MENFRFKDVPAFEVRPLSFAASEKNLAEWLASLCVLPNEIAAEKILHVSLGISQWHGQPDIQLKLLQQLLQSFHIIAESLQKHYLDASQPLDEKTRRCVELVVWNYLQLARILFGLVRLHSDKLTKEQQVLALYLSLETLNHAQLHIALSYRLPMEGFWLLCYEVFRRAEQAGLLTLAVNLRGYKAVYSNIDSIIDGSASIEKSFKQLLIFYLSDTQQFRPRDMLVVYRYLVSFSMKAAILSGYQQSWREGVCVVNLSLDSPPHKIFDDAIREDSMERFIAPIAVAKSMYEAYQKKSDNTLHMINYEVISRAINTLGLGRKRKYKRTLNASSSLGILGLKGLVSYLQPKVAIKVDSGRAAKTPEFMQPNTIGIWQKQEFDLIPNGEEVLHQLHHTYQRDIKQDTPLGKLLKIGLDKEDAKSSSLKPESLAQPENTEMYLGAFEVQDSSAKGYSLLTTLPNAEVKIGDVVAIIKDDDSNVELGLIRRINQMDEQRLRLGVEMLSFQSELVYVSNRAKKDSDMWAMFLPGVETIKQPDSLIYSSSLLKVGEIVNILRQGGEQQYRLQRIIQATSAVVHAELQALSDH